MITRVAQTSEGWDVQCITVVQNKLGEWGTEPAFCEESRTSDQEKK